MTLLFHIYIYTQAFILSTNILLEQDRQFKNATAKLNAGDVKIAIALYENILSEGYKSAEIYNNLGVAYFKYERVGLSILNFERGLLIEPGNMPLKKNIAYVRSQLNDTSLSPGNLKPHSFISRLYFKLRPDQLAILALLFLWIGISSLIMNLKYKKKYLLYGAVFSVMLAISCHLLAHLQTQNKTFSSNGVIMGNIKLRLAPSVLAKEVLVLHEGNIIEICDSFDGWKKVTYSENINGWIPDTTIVSISN
jgi:tetratricopeptide (TPR) repeat protein